MSRYHPNGRGHRTMRLLEQGPLSLDELRLMSNATSRSAGKKLWLMLAATIRHGFIICMGGAYSLTPGGAAVVARLDAGVEVEVDDEVEARPTVRFFGRAA